MRVGLSGAMLAAALLLAAGASAQVTVNTGALDLLPAPRAQTGAQPGAQTGGQTAPRRVPAVRPRPSAQPQQSGQPQQPGQAGASRPAVPPVTPPAPPVAATRPVLPTVPPAVAALPPAAPVPAPRPQPAPIAAVMADAPGTAAPMQGGVRVTFGPDRQDLNPVTEAAIRAVARGLKDPATSINIYAYAAGVPEDPSTSRRLALARALAARAVLINEGIASTRIYPRALGPTGGAAGADRVDVVAGAPGPPAGNVGPAGTASGGGTP